jgi:hypothetical protein
MTGQTTLSLGAAVFLTGVKLSGRCEEIGFVDFIRV